MLGQRLRPALGVVLMTVTVGLGVMPLVGVALSGMAVPMMRVVMRVPVRAVVFVAVVSHGGPLSVRAADGRERSISVSLPLRKRPFDPGLRPLALPPPERANPFEKMPE